MNPRSLSESDLLTPGRVLIKRKQLLQKVPLCERTILEMEKRGEFPRRFAITSRLVAWDLEEIDAWIAAQHSAAHQLEPPGTKKPRCAARAP
jgi:prophage regulatory protein